ncbi:putative hydrolases of hd superfamily [Bacteriophage sp.]|nr:putative hydrolases of hd superfamily [Caudoviricetes sp.]UOF79970.1 putative hydrolases of hd superfamily [Bacteriophage sp.]
MKALVEATLYRDAGAVKRYHVKRTHRQQSIAEHTFGMLMLVKQVTEGIGEYGMQARCQLYEAILHHDLPELMTGDVPAPIKRVHPELGPLMDSIEQDLYPLYRDYTLTGEEAALLKWADRMELVLWCLEEFKMGNSYTKPTVARGLGWVLASYLPEYCRTLTGEVVEEARTLGIEPATGAELELNA